MIHERANKGTQTHDQDGNHLEAFDMFYIGHLNLL
ncbi:hypothetical protein VRRI112168_17630 [Vreelandella rituensis]